MVPAVGWKASGLGLAPTGLRWFSPGAVAGLLGLRCWAQGCRSDEAAVELLACVAVGGWAVDVARSWVLPCHRPGWFWLDGARLSASVDMFPVMERPVVVLASLLAGNLAGDWRTVLPQVPSRYRTPVLVAFVYAAAEAAGSGASSGFGPSGVAA